MKKKLAQFLSATMLLGALAGCGGATETSDTSGNSTSSSFDADSEITVVSRENGSGTRGAFIELMGIEEKGEDGTTTDNTTSEAVIANKTDVMLTNVSGDEYAIGYVSLGSLSSSVKAVSVDGVEATAENIKNGTYTVARPFNIATQAEISEVAQDFIDFILSSDGQEIVSDGYIKVDEDAAPYSGTMPAGKIVVAGSSSVSPIMEKLKEAYLEVNTNAEIELQTSDSTAGMTSAIEGTCDIGMASRDLKDSEKETLTATAIALDGIAIIVNPENPVENLTSDNIKDIFTGTVTAWSEVL
ncbi:MAG: substrate-binding domain-containing protein [Oscillospiraceae bacterium]|nr:substrate-binding domain-containing protein [Oscillospiraceae bacterium]